MSCDMVPDAYLLDDYLCNCATEQSSCQRTVSRETSLALGPASWERWS
jgi:hypothetical protein